MGGAAVAILGWMLARYIAHDSANIPTEQSSSPTHTAECVLEDEPVADGLVSKDSPRLLGIEKNLP